MAVICVRGPLYHVALLLALFLRAAKADLDFVSYDYGYKQTDFVPPVIESTVPEDSTEGHPVETAIRVTFSKKVYLGEGQLVLHAPGERRYVHTWDAQLSRDETTNRSVVLQLDAPLMESSEYVVELQPRFVVDFYGNYFLGDRFAFRTAGTEADFVAFSPLVQAPESSVVFALRTAEECLYGESGDEHRLQIWPSSGDLFLAPTASSSEHGMDGRCARVAEVSGNFPSISECRVADGRFQLLLRSALLPVTEYSLVVRWPVASGLAATSSVVWNLAATRTFNGIVIEVQRFRPWTQLLGPYVYSNIDNSSADLATFTMDPSPGQDVASWRGPGTALEFRVELVFGAVPAYPGARLVFVSAPLLAWSTNPAVPSNLTMLQNLVHMDPTYLSDSSRRALPCPHFFPGTLPFSTQCRLLTLGIGAHSYGFELRLPARGMNARAIEPHEMREFNILLPGLEQPMGAIFFFEVVMENPLLNGALAHSSRLPVTSTPSLNTTAGMSLQVLSSSYSYSGPTYVQVNRVVVEFTTGVHLRGGSEVVLALLEPSLARFERCQVSGDAPQPTGAPARIRGSPANAVAWILEPLTAAPGPQNFAAYPHIRYRTECLLYNGPEAVPYSRWRLTVSTTADALGTPLSFSRTFTSHRFFVAVPLAGAQVTPTQPLLARSQVVFVRFEVPSANGGTLAHWLEPSRRLRLQAPASFVMPVGACPGFWPLTSSSLPAAPLSKCVVAPSGRQLEVTISPFEPGFAPGETYAFRVVVGNPGQWSDVESRMQAGAQVARANWWSLAILEQSTGIPLVMLNDVPQGFSSETAPLRPDDVPNVHDTSFRIYRRPLMIQEVVAEDPHVGRTTRVMVTFTLSTPLAMTDKLQITAPEAFAWVQPPRLEEDIWLQGYVVPFPAREPEVYAAPWVMRVGVWGGAEASVLYGLALNITNPATWTRLDRELNFWSVETFSGFLGPLDRRGRRDAGVTQGYLLRGPLLHCFVAPSSRVLGDSSWVSLAFQLSEPVFADDRLNPGPAILRITAPNGYSFIAAADATSTAEEASQGSSSSSSGNAFSSGPADENSCAGLVDARAPPDSPPLPTAQFPHSYSPLPDPAGFHCSLEADIWGIMRVLTMEAMQQEGLGLLAHVLYAFRVHIANPAYDRIWDVRWSLETVGLPSSHSDDGHVYESCSLPAHTPSLQAAEATLVAAAPTGSLPAQRAWVQVEVAGSVVAAAFPEPLSLSLLAPPGFAFPRSCAGSITLEGEDYHLTSCSAQRAEAVLQVSPSQAESPLVLIAAARAPPSLLGTDGSVIGPQTLQWGLRLLSDAGGQAPRLQGPGLRIMSPVTFQPTGLPYFSMGQSRQRALLTVALPDPLPAGGLLELAAPRHMSFSFDTFQGPCAALFEDPEVLGTLAAPAPSPATAQPGESQCASSGSGATDSSCTWPLVRSCSVSRSGTRLEILLARALQPLTTYCIELRILGPSAGSPPQPASATARQERGSAAMELAPALLGDRGHGWGVAPFVDLATHLSLCYSSRAPKAEPAELVARMAASSLGAKRAGAEITGRLCVIGAPLAVHEPTPTCRILEPAEALQRVPGPTCVVLPAENGCESQCVAISGAGIWIPFRRVVAALQVRMPSGARPRLDFQFFDDTGSLLQAATAAVDLPVLDGLGTPTLTAPRAASTLAPFEVVLAIDWEYISAALGEAFENPLDAAEEASLLDVSTPQGLSISPTCQPAACREIVPDDINPVPGMRIFLREPADTNWQRRLRGASVPKGPPSAHTAGDPGLALGCSELRSVDGHGGWSEPSATASCGVGKSGQRRLFDTSGLPPEMFLLVSAVEPLTQGDATGNVWSLVLRSSRLLALAAEDLTGPGVAEQMEARVTSSSVRAGDNSSRYVVEFRLQSPLPEGGLLVVEPPSEDIPCSAELAEPADLLGLPPEGQHAEPPEVSARSCLLWIRQHLDEDVTFAFSMPLTNPILTPVPNIWFLQTLVPATEVGSTAWRAHSAVETDGFKIAGELELLRIMPKSVYPQAVTPLAIHFKLRTPLPELAPSTLGPVQEDPAVTLRFAISAGGSEAMVSAFLASRCMLDVMQGDVLVEPVQGAEVLQPDDCLVDADGTAVAFFFAQPFQASLDYVVWTWIRNPTMDIVSDPNWAYSISTIVSGNRVVHRMSTKLTPLLGVKASIDCGSYATGGKHRAVVTVTNGRMILGQRGSIEVTLPLGYRGSCEDENFRARPSLPTTARCRSHEASDAVPGRVVVYWRTLLSADRLRPPYEFSFTLVNSENTTQVLENPEYAWHIRIYEGDNQEAVMDGTPLDGFRPFELCPSIPFSLRREDPRILSIVFQVGFMDLAGFDDQSLSGGFDNLVRVQVMSSPRAALLVACPETSIWLNRTGLQEHLSEDALGLPVYTTCANTSLSETLPPSYEMSAKQHRSAALFLLPFATPLGSEPYGLEVVLHRIGDSPTGISESEQAAELVSVSIESTGIRRACASAPLGPAPYGLEDGLFVPSVEGSGDSAETGGASTVATG